ncbi:hypothetical protein BWQ96_04854 [Gracilariopsis chorda]|uniref:Uncharacterized protein n=1 Tax=Gracilariopsis chorda TaxID=448386 RepID=A0A2V3ITL1_9FLOR|nr:hypothetical protein BWQ96_04854 [Gracilariopsis chorda]|eukprot:PXF45439.1 hypothetical protein BWQ96_04854 [Gracilariopsis chorda]
MFSAFSDVESGEEDIGTPPSSNASSPKLDSTPEMPTFSGLAGNESERDQQVPMRMDQFALNASQTNYIYRSNTEDDLSFVFRFHFGIQKFQNPSSEQMRQPMHIEQSSSGESDTEIPHSIFPSEPAGRCRQRFDNPRHQSVPASTGLSGVELLKSPCISPPEPDENLHEHGDTQLQLPSFYQSTESESKEDIDKSPDLPPPGSEKRLQELSPPSSCENTFSGSASAPDDQYRPSPVSAYQNNASGSAAVCDNACITYPESKGSECGKRQVPRPSRDSSILESGFTETSDIERTNETKTRPKIRKNRKHGSIWKRIREHAFSAITYLRSAPRRAFSILGSICRRVARLFSR